MKNFLLSLMFSLTFLPISAQVSVLGIDFGKSYEVVKEQLCNRYGKYNVYEDNGSLEIYNLKMGDYTFDIGTFDFQYSGNNSFFYYARFQMIFKLNESSKAKELRDNLSSTLGKKYRCGYMWTNEQGYRCYSYALPGEDPARNPICDLYVQKAASKSKGDFLYVILQYGPIHFINETDDF